jgi:hypothetical protein
MTEVLPETCSSPVTFLICFIFLFYYMGLAFFAGIMVFVVAFVLNFFLAQKYSKLMKVQMES